MGTIHYLIDDEGKNALCVQKWYALSPASWADVTDEEIDAAREGAEVLADTAKAWRREVAGGRGLNLAIDTNRPYPWQDEDYNDIPGWTVYEVDGSGGWIVDKHVPTPIPLPHADPVGPVEGWSWAEVAGGGES